MVRSFHYLYPRMSSITPSTARWGLNAKPVIQGSPLTLTQRNPSKRDVSSPALITSPARNVTPAIMQKPKTACMPRPLRVATWKLQSVLTAMGLTMSRNPMSHAL